MTSNASPAVEAPRVDPSQVELLLAQIESLPTLPAVAARLLELTLGDTSSAREIAELIASDQSLSARILSLVHRAEIGSDVQTVDRAVVMLGADAVRSLVLSIQVFDLFSQRREEAASRFDRAGFWRHSLAVGCAARLLAEACRKNKSAGGRRGGAGCPSPEDVFVCGLLHDLGKVAFDACFPKSYDRVIEGTEAIRGDIADVEREVFGIDHTVAGHRLGLYWKLPAAIGECMWLHHQTPGSTPTRIAHAEHVKLVQAADRLVRQMHIGYSGNYNLADWPVPVSKVLGLSEETLAKLMAELPALIEKRAEAIGLQRITSQEVFNDALVRTHIELAQANTALAAANRRLEEQALALSVLAKLNRSAGQERTHEQILQSLVEAAAAMTSCRGWIALGLAAERHMAFLVAASAGRDRAHVEAIPLSAVGGAEALASRLGSTAVNVDALPGVLRDHLDTMLAGIRGQGRPIRCGGKPVGMLLAADEISADAETNVGLLCDWAGSWLQAAESAWASRQLAEELADINRRFVNSQAEVARMRSLAMVGEMAAGAAHEINNPLAVISGRAQLIRRDAQAEEVRRSATLIADHAQRASDIVTELMEFAKPTPPKPSTWPLRPLLEEIREHALARGSLTAATFLVEVSDDVPCVRADRDQIRLLMDELVRNALDALRDQAEPRLMINCRADVADERVVIRIEDNGCGMTPDVAEHAMDPFFSHRPAGRGRGLGLSRAARYAEINGGRLRLSSRAKEGTAVFVELPAAGQG